MIKFELNDDQLKLLEDHMKQVPGKSEDVINKTLKAKGTKAMIQAIVGFMPTSSLPKTHAKGSNPIKEKMMNLGFELAPKPRFKYLVFPNSGIGLRNKVAQEFFEKGADQANPKIIEMLLEALIKVNQEIGGN